MSFWAPIGYASPRTIKDTIRPELHNLQGVGGKDNGTEDRGEGEKKHDKVRFAKLKKKTIYEVGD